MSTRARNTHHHIGYIRTFLILAILLSAPTAFGADYQPLVGLPQVEGTGQGLSAYFNQLYMVTVAVGAILAFLKIAFAGVKYSMSGIVTDKESAKHDIQGALLGLAILLIPFVVLNTIYGGLTNLNILERAGNVRVNTDRPSTGALNPTTGANTPQNSDATATQSRTVTYQRTCPPIPTGQTDPNGAPEYAGFDCAALTAQCRGAGTGGTPVQTRDDLITCTYTEIISPSTAACALNPC
jgi:hypothetical protein